MRQHHRAERRRIEIDRLVGAALQPREQIEIGRGEPGPHQFDLVRVLVAEGCGGGLGEPRRDADPHRAGDELQQRPAAGLVEFVEPARELFRQFGLAQYAQVGDDLGEGRRRRVVVEVRWRSGWGLFLGRSSVTRPEISLPASAPRNAARREGPMATPITRRLVARRKGALATRSLIDPSISRPCESKAQPVISPTAPAPRSSSTPSSRMMSHRQGRSPSCRPSPPRRPRSQRRRARPARARCAPRRGRGRSSVLLRLRAFPRSSSTAASLA